MDNIIGRGWPEIQFIGVSSFYPFRVGDRKQLPLAFGCDAVIIDTILQLQVNIVVAR
jgi:hypothetical protein